MDAYFILSNVFTLNLLICLFYYFSNILYIIVAIVCKIGMRLLGLSIIQILNMIWFDSCIIILFCKVVLIIWVCSPWCIESWYICGVVRCGLIKHQRIFSQLRGIIGNILSTIIFKFLTIEIHFIIAFK